MFDIASYEEAGSVEEAWALMQLTPEARLVAGGSDLLIKIHNGALRDAKLISIRGIPGLQGIRLEDDGTIIIGSGTTFSAISADPLIKTQVQVLAEAASVVGGPQIRNIATIGGNICNGAPSADSAPALLTLNAALRIEGLGGSRVVPVREFFRGPGRVDLKPGELVTAVLLARNDYQDTAGCYIKFGGRQAMDIAVLSCAATCRVSDNGQIEDFRLAFALVGPVATRLPLTESLVIGNKFSEDLVEEVGQKAVTEADPRNSWRASRDLRLQLVGELSKRALRQVYFKAGGDRA